MYESRTYEYISAGRKNGAIGRKKKEGGVVNNYKGYISSLANQNHEYDTSRPTRRQIIQRRNMLSGDKFIKTIKSTGGNLLVEVERAERKRAEDAENVIITYDDNSRGDGYFRYSDMSKVASQITLVINKHVLNEDDDDCRTLYEVMENLTNKLVDEIKKVINKKKSIKVKFNLWLRMKKKRTVTSESVSLDKYEYVTKAIESDTVQVTMDNIKDVVDASLNYLGGCILCNSHEGSMMDDSNWVLHKYLYLKVDCFTTRALRASSYIPTPPKFSNAKCGLINIRNEDNECFKWCMLYHQSRKDKNDNRVTALRKVENKYDFSNINYPASLDDIRTFEKQIRYLFMYMR